MKQARLCVVDGTYELFRSYYGVPSRLAPNGQEVGAAVALGRSLASLARGPEFTHFAVAFDTQIESFRNDLFAGYKTGEGIEPALFDQFPLAEIIVAKFGFVVLGMIEFEADDALATLASQFADHEDVSEVVIASPDKDLMQCVRPGVVLWDRKRDIRYDAEGVEKKMGVRPEHIPDYLGLVGDTADGIPGVPRWGARSAGQALSHFGSLEKIPRDEQRWDIKVRGLSALLSELKKHEDEVLLYRKLATLRNDVPLKLTLDQLKYTGPDEVGLSLLFEELGVASVG